MNIFAFIKQMLQTIIDKFLNYPKCLDKAKQAFNNAEMDKAEKYYQKVIRNLGRKRALDSKQKRYLGEAFLGQGNIHVARKDSSAAFSCYNKAIDNSVQIAILPPKAIMLLGAIFCNKKDKSDRAVEIYLGYIGLKSGDDVASAIYITLERLCLIDETLVHRDREKAMLLNQRIQSINRNIDWTYYYLGVGAYLKNDKKNATKHFLNSVKLNEKRALNYYWIGKIYGDSNDTESAERHFIKFIEIIPDNEELLRQAEAYSYLGTSLIQNMGGFSDAFDLSIKANCEKLERAASYFEKSARKNDKDEHVWFNLARTFSCLNRHRQAIDAYNKAIAINNRNGEYFYLLTVALKKVKDYSEAITSITSALSVDDQDKYRLLLTELYLLTSDFVRAENECLKVYGKNNEYGFEAFCILIYALYHQTKYKNIIDACEKYPKELAFTRQYPDVYYFVARAYSNADQFNRAIEWYIKLIEMEERADAVYYLGCAFANKGDYGRALTAFRRGIEKETEFKALAYLQCGIIHSSTNQLGEAEDNYLKAYASDTKNIHVLYSIGVFYYLQGENEKALNYLSELLILDSGHGAARFIRGHIYEKQGNIPSAITEYDSLLNNNRVGPLSRMRLGVIYFKQAEYKKAFEYLYLSYQYDDRTDALLFYYGLVCALTNRFKPSLESWDVLLHRHPEDERLKVNIYRVHYLLGCSYANERKYMQAIQEWKEYLKGYADDTKTKNDIAELYFRLFTDEIKTHDIQKARDLLFEATAFDNENKKYIFYAALCDYKSGSFDDCVTHLDNLLDTELDPFRIKYHKGVALLRKGEREQAVELLSEVSKAQEKNKYAAHARWLIANEYILNSEYENAIPILEALRC